MTPKTRQELEKEYKQYLKKLRKDYETLTGRPYPLGRRLETGDFLIILVCTFIIAYSIGTILVHL